MRCLDATVRASGSRVHPDGQRRPIAWEPKILVDKLPDLASLRYEAKSSGTGTAYFAHQDGYAHFVWHNPRDQSGFGGSTIRGTLTDGSEFAVKGPWSSSPSAMTKLGFPATISVSATDEPAVWERGYTFYASSVTAEWFLVEAMPHLPGFIFEAEDAPYVGDDASHEQARIIASGLRTETVSVYELRPRHIVACETCNGRGHLILEEPCHFSLCRDGIVWPDTDMEKPCSSCGGDGRARTYCKVCQGNGTDVAATISGVMM